MTELTKLDPNKTYVDSYGRRWQSATSPYWTTEGFTWHVTSDELPKLFPDLREHVPQWYEGAVAKGWVWNAKAERLVRVGIHGEVLTIEHDGEEYLLRGHSTAIILTCNLASGDLDFCLAAAEPLVWKGVAS